MTRISCRRLKFPSKLLGGDALNRRGGAGGFSAPPSPPPPAPRPAPPRARQPFGQVPTYEDGDVLLFESGAIVHHIATTHNGLLPADPAARARAVEWMFAALNVSGWIAGLEQLLKLPESIQEKIWLMHYDDDMEDYVGRTGKMTFMRQHVVYDLE